MGEFGSSPRVQLHIDKRGLNVSTHISQSNSISTKREAWPTRCICRHGNCCTGRVRSCDPHDCSSRCFRRSCCSADWHSGFDRLAKPVDASQSGAGLNQNSIVQLQHASRLNHGRRPIHVTNVLCGISAKGS